MLSSLGLFVTFCSSLSFAGAAHGATMSRTFSSSRNRSLTLSVCWKNAGVNPASSMAISPSRRFCAAFFRMFSSIVFSLIRR